MPARFELINLIKFEGGRCQSPLSLYKTVVKHLKKTKDILIFVFALILFSVMGYGIFLFFYVQEKYAGEPIEHRTVLTSSRYLFNHSLNSLEMRTEFIVTKTISDSLINYNYKSESDSTRNFEIIYRIKSESLFLSLEEYKVSKENVFRNKEDSELWFDNYISTEPIIDGMGPIMFNYEYGIIAITGPLGPTHLFLAKKNDTILKKKILDKLH